MKPIIDSPKALFCTVEEEQWRDIVHLAQELELDLSYVTRKAVLLGVQVLRQQNETAQLKPSIVAA
ncbi:MAG: hypothetical protein GY880_19965 [Planctomycetaceae bacterium]|nr:hypothetical protein [Planctomycetaceae bacterium]